MRTIGTLVRHELRLLWRDGVLVTTAGIFALAVLAATVNGLSWAQRQSKIVDDIRREERARFAHVTTRLRDIEHKRYVATDPYEDPSRPSIAGGWMAYRFATAPPSPLAALAVGQTDLRPGYMGATVWSTSWPTWINRRVLVGESEIDNPISLVAGRFDLVFVVVYLLPLLVIGLTQGMLADERERGTLALLAVQPLRMEMLVSAKVVTRALIVGVSLALLAAVAILTLTERSATAYLRLSAWLTIAASYGCLWFAIGVLASTCRGSSAVNAMRLASAWVGLVVVTPALLNALTAWWYPLPERATMVQQARQAQLDAEREHATLIEAFYGQHPDLVPDHAAPDVRQYAATTLYAQHEEVDRRLAPIIETFDTRLTARTRAIESLSVLSPASAATVGLVDAAGTGPERHRHFRDQAERFRSAWREYFVPRMFRLETIVSTDVEEFPRFAFVDEDGRDVGRRTLRRASGLLLPALVLLWWCSVRIRRINVLD